MTKIHEQNKAFFLDRDGVIIKDFNYLTRLEQIVFLRETFKTLRLIKKKFFYNNSNKSICGWEKFNFNKRIEINS